MRILFAIPHYYQPTGGLAADGREHGSATADPGHRVAALEACVTALHAVFGPRRAVIHHARKVAHRVEPRLPYQIDVVVCTTGDRHLLDRVSLPAGSYRHRVTRAEPLLLGFECHAVLRDALGRYDYYCYLEDDVVIHDPWFFIKLAWFSRQAGPGKLLQPNRFESGPHAAVSKLYVDGDLREQVTAAWQDIRQEAEFMAEAFGVPVLFRRPLNPHAGCFFLNAEQMAHWAAQPHFLDRDCRFIGPLESAASLGIVRTFRVYKPALENGDFLEVRHHGNAYLDMIAPPDQGSGV